MKTIILSGGLGYRLKEETEFKPKPMVQVGGKPILWHIMKIYSHYGFNDFIVALGYKGEMIKDYFLNQQYFIHDFTLHTKTGRTTIHRNKTGLVSDNFKITFVDTGQETLPGERIMKLKEYIPESDENFMVTYGDGVSDVDIKELVKFHKKSGKIGTVTGVHPKSKYGIFTLDSEGTVNKFVEKPILNEWVNGGFMIFKKNFFSYLRENELEHEAFRRLVKEKQLSTFTHNGFWFAVDTYRELEDMNKLWNNGDPAWKVWK
jgi:glucose-1-phosphate cytidylyltransferase